MADDTRFRELSDEERASLVGTRRRAIETELFQHELNRVGATDPSSFDEDIKRLNDALKELDRIDPAK